MCLKTQVRCKKGACACHKNFNYDTSKSIGKRKYFNSLLGIKKSVYLTEAICPRSFFFEIWYVNLVNSSVQTKWDIPLQMALSEIITQQKVFEALGAPISRPQQIVILENIS